MMGRPGNDAGMAGLAIIMAGAAWTGVGMVAGSVGGAAAAREYQPCVNEAVECARQFKMAERATEIENARNLYFKAALRMDAGQAFPEPEAAMAPAAVMPSHTAPT